MLIAGCGYVGVRLASRLAREGASVFALRRGRGPLPVGVEPVVADLARIETLGSLPPRIDAVVYTAAPGTSDEAAYRSIYLDGVDNLLRAIAERGERPPRFVFASSTAVYGQDRGEWVDETSPTEPRRWNGETLLAAERLLAARLPEAIAVRFGGIYGPGRTRLVDQVRRGEARLRKGEHFTNRIHRDDAARALALLALADAPAHRCYLGVDDEPADESDVLTYLAELLGVPAPPPVDDGRRAPRRAGSKRCRNDRLKAEGLALRFPTFREGYADMLRAARAAR
ncbi:MAG: NAD-dependent epimerase/dehydratase family protein [Myxococcota bacterium]|nr:NAD-dependent epimerase/dehydratase family protein [Myxococcales bacterium]